MSSRSVRFGALAATGLLWMGGLAVPGVAGAAPAPVPVQDDGGEDAVYRFPKKQVLRYLLKQNSKFSYKADAGKSINVETTETTLDIHSDTDAPGAGLEVKYRDLKLARTGEDGNFAVDTRKKYSLKAIEKDQRLGVFVGLVGDGFAMSVGAKGEVRIGGVDWMVHRATTRGLVGGLPLVMIVAKQVGDILSTAATHEGMGAAFLPLPTTIRKGDTWERELQAAISGIVFHQKFVYRATSVKKGKIAIAIGGVYEISVDGQPIPKTGTLKGSAAFDNTTGRLLMHKYTAAIKLPNIQMTDTVEWKFLKAVDREEAGPESFEQPLRASQELVERRLAKGMGKNVPAMIYPDLESKEPNSYACDGDQLRVIGKDEASHKLKVVTASGRVGWVLELQTRKQE